LLQCGVQVPLMRRHGYRFRLGINLHHPGIRRIAALIAPAIVGVSAVQFNVLVNTQIASFLQENGPVSWLSYAFRIIYLPIGLFGVAVGVVNLREVSVLAVREDWEELKETVANSIKLVALMSIPSMVGLMILAAPIVHVLFERGDFTASDTLYTAYALIFYSLGLFAYSCNKVYVPTFYALNDTRTPVRVSIIAVISNLIINLILVFFILPDQYRYMGLAFGTALSVSLSNALLAKNLRRRLGSFHEYAVLSLIVKSMGAAAVMGVTVYFLDRFFQRGWKDMNLLQELSSLAVCIVAGIVVYFGCCRLLRVKEVRYLVQLVRR
jgi:putative peptidoglycan lipid II flippase